MKIFLGIIVIVFFFSCGNRVEKEELPGRYVFSHWGKDTLDLRSDGTYHHHTFQDSQLLENRGTWILNNNGTEITFANFSSLTDGTGPGNWISRLRVQGGKVHLMYASDINAYYIKTEQRME